MSSKAILGVALLVAGASLLGPRAANAVDPKYIVVRLDEVRLLDSGDGNEGEIQYFVMGATGNRGRDPIAIQQTSFPIENWYEGEEDGANATFMGGNEQAVPIFAYREDQMGDELLISVGVYDDDETSDFVIAGHQVLAKVGVAVATYFTGPSGGAAVDKLSGAVQKELEDGGHRDHLGTYTGALRRSNGDGSTFGLPRGEHSKTFERQVGKVRIKYTVRRIADRAEVKNWCATVTLDRIRIVDDSDDGTQGDGDVYVRARVADRFDMGEADVYGASQLNGRAIALPKNKYTVDVGTGHDFPSKNVQLYSNGCHGLPVFLYVEVDVFEDDSQADCSGRTCDDVLGVLPLLLTQAWLRDNPGQRKFEIDARGDSGKAKFYLTVNTWNPHADPDAPLSH
jgi:hypothetical protein